MCGTISTALNPPEAVLKLPRRKHSTSSLGHHVNYMAFLQAAIAATAAAAGEAEAGAGAVAVGAGVGVGVFGGVGVGVVGVLNVVAS